MDQLRRPFLIITLICIALALLICIGSNLLSGPKSFAERTNSALQSAQSTPAIKAELEKRGIDIAGARDQLSETKEQDPPGLAIPGLGLINGILLLILILTALPMFVGDRITSTVQGIINIIGGLIGLIAGIVLAIGAFIALMIMVSLLLAIPFGTLAYLVIFGSFDTGSSALITTVVMVLQIVGAICLILAQERFLKSKGLVLLFATAILLTFVVSLLHSIVPGILVSITDAVGAIIIGIIGAIWSLVVLIGGIIGAIRLLQLGRAGGPSMLTRSVR
jgi:hypothetical protein